MNITRRLQILAGVVATCTAAGAGAGLLVAGVMLAMRLGHIHPALIWDLARLGTQTGAAFGAILGPPVVLGLLRRVPLHRVATEIFLGATYGGVCGLALSVGIAEPRPAIPLILTGAIAGFGVAAGRLWARHRAPRAANAAPTVG
jgi:hypothetical protein